MRKVLWVSVAGGLAVCLAGAGVALAVDGRRDGGVPTVVEVQAALTFAAGHVGDDDFCEVAATLGNCRALLQEAPLSPQDPPQIVCMAAYLGDGSHQAGRLLRVTGVDGAGASYTTDILALRSNNRAVLMNPVYWNGAKVSDSGSSDQRIDFDCD